MKLSVSQVKTYNASPAKWAGMYILWIKEDISNDAFPLGNIFEKRLCFWDDDRTLLEWIELQDKETFVADYDNLKHNAKGIQLPEWIQQYKVEWELLWQYWIWYVDLITDDCIYDIKTSRYLSDPESKSINMWSNMTSYDEYALQLWVYMKLTGKTKAKIIEVSKHKYKDERVANQTIDFELTKEFDEKMINKRQPVINQMSDMYNKYSLSK